MEVPHEGQRGGRTSTSRVLHRCMPDVTPMAPSLLSTPNVCGVSATIIASSHVMSSTDSECTTSAGLCTSKSTAICVHRGLPSSKLKLLACLV